MALIKEQTKIVTVGTLLSLNLEIPNYQRAYTWSIKSATTLFRDIFDAFEKSKDEYRLGSVIMHHHDDSYNIVDGQQRMTTIAILLYLLPESDENVKLSLLSAKYQKASIAAIRNNLEVLKRRVAEIGVEEKKKLTKYILERCTIVQIVTDSEQEAFQFFDSQNARGKSLSPHDLLKAYHLREMNNVELQDKISIVEQWENMNQWELIKLFEVYLYPITQWIRNRDALHYNSQTIDTFRGIRTGTDYNSSIYHIASHLYIENLENRFDELGSSTRFSHFQLSQPIIAGKRFFLWTVYYKALLDDVRAIIVKNIDENLILRNGVGNEYVKQLFETVVLLFADRFGIDEVTEQVLKYLYTWSYSLRLGMQSLRRESINNYARGYQKINNGLDMFCRINEMKEPTELYSILFEDISLQCKLKEKNQENLLKQFMVVEISEREESNGK